MLGSRITSFAFLAAVAVVLVGSGSAFAGPAGPTFTHGVASGEVTSTSAILWTRVDQSTPITVEVFTDAGLKGPPAFQGTVTPAAQNDYTARATIRNLTPSTAYYYRWRSGPVTSDVGSFTTAATAAAAANVHFAYSGDSDGTLVGGQPYHNNFEVLDAVRAENPDFFAYLGDTIYSDSSLRPSGPATTLDEYRDAYKVNRGYAALTNLLKSTSTVAQWDDHEVLNDFDGQTVDPSRYANGRKAFLEYMPMPLKAPLVSASLISSKPEGGSGRGCAGVPLMRTFHRGSNVDIIVPDERSCRSASVEAQCQGDLGPTVPSSLRPLFGLPPAPPAGCLDAINDPNRTMLGAKQKQRFESALLNSTAKFKFVINEVPIQNYYALPYDRWEGYAAERREILNFIRTNGIQNVVFLTTDSHANISNEVFVDRFTDPQPIAYELITGPIATFTLQDEILALLGPTGLNQFHQVLSLVGADCRNLDTFSYGSVDVSGTSKTATVTLKDANGATLHDDLNAAVSCTKTFS